MIYEYAIKMSLSLILSAILGYEREKKLHSAGMRTFVIVALFSTASAIIESETRINLLIPSVILSTAVISYSTVFFSSKGRIKGLTTASALTFSALIGIAIGLGMYLFSIIAFISLFFTLSILSHAELYLRDNSNHLEVQLELKDKNELQNFLTTIRRLGMRIDNIELNSAFRDSGLSVYTVAFTINSKDIKKYKRHSEIIRALSTLDYISNIEEIV